MITLFTLCCRNVFGVTHPSRGESKRASIGGCMCFLSHAPWQTLEQTVELPMTWYAMRLIWRCCDISVITLTTTGLHVVIITWERCQHLQALRDGIYRWPVKGASNQHNLYSKSRIASVLRRTESTVVCYENHVPDIKVHRANMGHTWVLSAPDGPRVGLMNLAIWGGIRESSM